MTDLAVHRLRIGNWVTASIQALAVDKFSCMVAVGREDGDIEVA